MEWHSIIRPHLSIALGGCGLSRDALLLVLSALHHTLPEQADRLRMTRDPDQPDWLFLFRVSVADGALLHRLAFGVDDATAPAYLFVENVSHEMLSVDPYLI